MSPADVALRNETYRAFVVLGRAPSAEEVAAEVGSTAVEVLQGWRRLHDEHALVLDAGRTEIRMANPFSAVPTAYRVQAGDRWWYANCAWDAFGICAALRGDGRIEASCPDCGHPSPSPSRTDGPTRRPCSSTACCPRGAGGTTSSSPRAR